MENYRDFAYRLLHGTGIEIGALNQPAPLPKELSVSYCDVISQEEAKRLFPETDSNNLVTVNHLIDLDNSGLRQFKSNSLDFVILSHVIEHVANPIAVLDELFRVCKPTGHVVLAVPDKDYTFDKPRQLTPFTHLLEEYRQHVTTVSDAHYLDFLKAVHPEVFSRPAEQFARDLAGVRARREHAHVWNSASFVSFMREALGLLKITATAEVELLGTQTGHEYFAVWRKNNSCID
ncbi:MAG: class I SAM-dependent methyltransferase [Crocinitomicaceae bacterium]|nr:MAG: class I SAM-dependent methyltransferase [Crocinitomicaceae bacterium]